MSQSDKGKPLLSKLGAEEHIANASENGVDGSKGVKSDRSAPTTEGRDDENELRTHTDTVGLAGLDATPLIVAEGMMARVGAPTASYPGFPYDLDMGAGEEGTQGDISIPMDEDEEELQPSFGVLSNTTFDPSFAYQPHTAMASTSSKVALLLRMSKQNSWRIQSWKTQGWSLGRQRRP